MAITQLFSLYFQSTSSLHSYSEVLLHFSPLGLTAFSVHFPSMISLHFLFPFCPYTFTFTFSLYFLSPFSLQVPIPLSQSTYLTLFTFSFTSLMHSQLLCPLSLFVLSSSFCFCAYLFRTFSLNFFVLFSQCSS